MITLSQLKNTSRPAKGRNRLGRGIGSGNGKTCGRGHKGDGSRSGYKRRFRYEGGQFPLYMKLPAKGFSNAMFRRTYDTINLAQLDRVYEDGEIINEQTLYDRGLVSGKKSVKILGNGNLTKKVKIEVDAISKEAQNKLQKAKIQFALTSET